MKKDENGTCLFFILKLTEIHVSATLKPAGLRVAGPLCGPRQKSFFSFLFCPWGWFATLVAYREWFGHSQSKTDFFSFPFCP
jgi:hypothetical protein